MPRGFHIASAWVDINADAKGLREQVKKAVEDAVKGQDAKIKLNIDSKGLRREVEDALKEATKGNKPQIPIGIKATGLRGEVSRALKQATESQKPKVKLGINSTGLRAEVQRALTMATKDQKPTVKLGISTVGLRGEVQRALTAATAGADRTVHIRVDVDGGQVARALADTHPTITPDVDMAGARARMMAAIRGLNLNADVNINPDIDAALFRAKIQAEVGRIRQRLSVPITPDINISEFEAKIRAAAATVRGSNTDIPVDLNPRINQLKMRAELAAALRSISGTLPIHLDIDQIRLAAQVKAAVIALNAMPFNLKFRTKLDVDTAAATAKLAAFAVQAKLINEFLGHGVAGFHAWAGAAIALGSVMAPLFGTIIPALKSVGTSSAAMVPLLTMAATTMATLFMGLSHVGATIGGIFQASVTDVKQLKDNLATLSPNARAFADEMLRVQNAWTTTRKTVQDSLFKNSDVALRDFTNNVLPTLTLGLAGTAMQLNRMGISMLNVFKTSARSGDLAKAFGAIQVAMEPLVPIPGQFLNMLIKMTIAAGPLLTRMTTSMENWASRMTEKMNSAFAAGTLQAAISKAGDSIVSFFRRIANNPEWETFLKRMTDAGPRMSEALGHMLEAIIKLMNAAAPFGTLIMGIVDAFAQFIKWIPTDFLTMFLTKLLLINIAFKAAAWIMGLTRALAGLKLVLIALKSQGAMIAILNTSKALKVLGATEGAISKLATTIRWLGRTAVVLAALWAAKELIDHFAESNVSAAPDVDKLQQAILRLVKTGQQTGEFKKAFGDISGLADGFKILDAGIKKNIGGWEHLMGGTKVSDWTRKVIDNFKNGGDSVESWTKKTGSLDKALSALVEGGHGDIAAAFIAKVGISAKDSQKYLTGYNKSVTAAKLAQQLANETMGLYGQKALEVQAALDSQKNAAEGLRQSIEALNDAHRKAMGGDIAMEQAIDDATQSLKDNGKTLDINTQKGRDNKKALLDLASATSEAGMAKIEETGSWTQANAIYQRGRGQLVALAEKMGMSATAAKKFADQVIQIPDRTISIDADYQNLDQKITDAQTKLNGLKQRAKVAVGADKTRLDAEVAAAQRELNNLKQQRDVLVNADIHDLDAKIKTAQNKVDGLKQKRKTAIGADKTKLDSEVRAAQAKVDALKQRKATVLLVQNLVKSGVASAQNMIDAVHGKTVTITVMINGKKTGVDPDKYYSYGPHRFGGMIKRATGGMVQAFDGGGSVMGPGGPMSDVIHAMLSNGEFVMRAAAVKKYGPNFMNLLNRGMFPKFAQGGAVTASTGRIPGKTTSATSKGGSDLVQAVKILADTNDIDTKVLKTQQLLKAIVMPKPVAFTALDQTKAATAQAKANFQSVANVNKTAYNQIGSQTNVFRAGLGNQMTALKNNNTTTWQQWRTGLESRTTGTYNTIKANTNSFSAATVGKLTSTKAASHGQWDQFKSGLQSRTNSAYSAVKNATTSFGSQTTSKFKGIVNNTGTAWGGLSPKFKPPVSYLVHSVINQGIVGSMNAIIGKLGGGNKVGAISVAGFARGGPIYGEGTATSDSIPARLSTGEYVIQAKAVKKFGVGFFNQVNSGGMPAQGAGYKPGFATGGLVNIRMAPGFATGGAVPSADVLNKILGDGGDAGAKKMTDFIMSNYVLPLIDSGSGGSAMKAVQKAGVSHIQANVQKFVKENFGGAGSASAGLRWAKTQYGKPYQWGGNGNPSWDCSGFMSAIESVIRGEKPHRRWATGSFGSSGPSGWKRNATAPFQIGITNAGVGHTAGTIGKENVESAGGIGVHGGVGVPRGASDGLFTSRWGYVGPNATKKASGGYISGPGGPTADAIPAMLSNGEFVIRASAAKKLGLGYLNMLNTGQLRGFATGGAVAKAPTSDIQDANNAASLQTLVTLREALSIANGYGISQKNEAQASIGYQDSLSTLLTNLTQFRSAIYDAFKGKTQDVLAAKFTATANALIPLQQRLDTVTSSLTDAQSSLDAVKGQFDQLKGSVSDSIVAYGDITKIGKYGTSASTLITQMTADAGKAAQFSQQLQQLQGKGVNATLISQIASAGITGGGMNTAQSLLNATPEQLAQINALQAQIASVADSAGTAAAEGTYGAGVAAAQGLVNGLKSQQAALEAEMTVIANTLVNAVRAALGIASPSRVMAQLGRYTGLGYAEGINTTGNDVKSAALKLANIPVTATANADNTSSNGTMGTVTSVGDIHVHVNGTFDFDSPKSRQLLATNIASEVKEAIRRDDRKRM